MKQNKLVRDKIPKIMKSEGQNPIVHIANQEEYWRKLKEKLREEVEEFIESEDIEEMADVFEVITAINSVKKWDIDEIIKIQKIKRDKKGGFRDRIILDKIIKKKK